MTCAGKICFLFLFVLAALIVVLAVCSVNCMEHVILALLTVTLVIPSSFNMLWPIFAHVGDVLAYHWIDWHR